MRFIGDALLRGIRQAGPRASTIYKGSTMTTLRTRRSDRSDPSRFAASVVEAMESRCHRSDTFSQSVLTESSISELSGYLMWGKVLVGGNGYWGPPGMVIGDATGEFAWNETVWDSNPEDGFDSGNVGFQMTADLSGTDSIEFVVEDTSPIGGYNTSSDCDIITMVKIRAGVRGGGMAMSWDGIAMSFYKDGVFQETLTIGSGPVADTMDATTAVAEEQILTVNVDPEAEYDKVVVGGTFRMQTIEEGWPGWDDIFGDVLVYGGNC